MTLTQLAQKHNLEPESAKAFLREWLDMQETVTYLHEYTLFAGMHIGTVRRKAVDDSEDPYWDVDNDAVTPLIARPTDLGD